MGTDGSSGIGAIVSRRVKSRAPRYDRCTLDDLRDVFSEIVGGSPNGYKYLVDSNYDWGQDAHRLKLYLDRQGIQHIYLNYFGTQFSTEFLKIPNTRVGPEQARQIRDGYLVVSVSELMRPDWDWLRNSRQPVARVAHTLFVYRFP